MSARCRFRYEDFTQELANAQQARQQIRQQLRRLVRVVRQLFRVKRCEVQLPIVGPLVLRVCFADRRQVPAWSLVRTLVTDHFHPGNFRGLALDCLHVGDYRLTTGLDYWAPDGQPEYYFEVRLEWLPYSSN